MAELCKVSSFTLANEQVGWDHSFHCENERRVLSVPCSLLSAICWAVKTLFSPWGVRELVVQGGRLKELVHNGQQNRNHWQARVHALYLAKPLHQWRKRWEDYYPLSPKWLLEWGRRCRCISKLSLRACLEFMLHPTLLLGNELNIAGIRVISTVHLCVDEDIRPMWWQFSIIILMACGGLGSEQQ